MLILYPGTDLTPLSLCEYSPYKQLFCMKICLEPLDKILQDQRSYIVLGIVPLLSRTYLKKSSQTLDLCLASQDKKRITATFLIRLHTHTQNYSLVYLTRLVTLRILIPDQDFCFNVFIKNYAFYRVNDNVSIFLMLKIGKIIEAKIKLNRRCTNELTAVLYTSTGRKRL